MRIAFALSGLHRIDRGAEVAIISVARELANAGEQVTLFGSGPHRTGEPYRYIQVPSVERKHFEGFPVVPMLRNETSWEEATFVPGLLARFHPRDFDVTATCAFPFTHWALRRPTFGVRPKHVFMTQNGDWPALSNKAEYRLFKCDGLVCTNPEFFERNRSRHRCALIPNGVDVGRFAPGSPERSRFGLPEGPIVLMVSALIPSKNVADGIIAAAKIPDVTLVVCGDGPLRGTLADLARELLPGRYHQLTVPAPDMPSLYRSADAFMHLSTDESFGNVFVEALATGLPIIAFDTARTRWIVGDSACYADRDDPNNLPEAIRAAMLGHVVAPPAQRHRAEQFSWSAIAKRYLDFFNEVAA